MTLPDPKSQPKTCASRQRQERMPLIWCGVLAPGGLLMARGVFAGTNEKGLLAWAQAHWWITLIGGAAIGAVVDIAVRIRARKGHR